MKNKLILLGSICTLTLPLSVFAKDRVKVGKCPNNQAFEASLSRIDDYPSTVAQVGFGTLKSAEMTKPQLGALVACKYEGESFVAFTVDRKYSFRTCVFNNIPDKRTCDEANCTVWCEER